MDKRIARGLAEREREERAKAARSTREELFRAVERHALVRLSRGKRLRPEDSRALFSALDAVRRTALADGSAIDAWGEFEDERGRVEILFAEGSTMRLTDSNGARPDYVERTIVLNGASIQWDRRRVRCGSNAGAIEISEHLQRRYLERTGDGPGLGPEFLREIARGLPTMAAFAAAQSSQARRFDDGDVAVFLPVTKGMCLGVLTRVAIDRDSGLVGSVTYNGGHRSADEPIVRELGHIQWYQPAGSPSRHDAMRVFSLRTFVDEDALRPAQTELRAKLLDATLGFANARAEVRRAIVAAEPDPRTVPEMAALNDLRDAVEKIADAEWGREAIEHAVRSWSHSSRGQR